METTQKTSTFRAPKGRYISGFSTESVTYTLRKDGTIPFCEFNFIGDDKLYKCIAWREKADTLRAKLKPNKKIALFGFENDAGEFVVQGLQPVGPEQKDRTRLIIEEHGSLDAYKRQFAEYAKTQAAKGFVPITTPHGVQFARTDDCIEHQGRWVMKIDYCIARLGAERVNDWMREEGVYDVGKLGRASSFSNIDFKKFRAAINDLVWLAKLEEEDKKWVGHESAAQNQQLSME